MFWDHKDSITCLLVLPVEDTTTTTPEWTEPTSTVTSTTLAPPDPEFSCNFEAGDFCQWISKGEGGLVPWSITQGSSSDEDTDPESDHTYHNGMSA